MTYNLKCPAVKRLMKEAQELKEPTDLYYAQPSEDNLFDWHFTIRGPIDSEFEGGIYHGRIILPTEYPMKPPNIMILTENGRFETRKKICLSISGYHPESWRPSWSIRTAILAVIGFMPTSGAGSIGSLDYNKEERKRLAKASLKYECEQCGPINCILKPLVDSPKKLIEEAKNLASQMSINKVENDSPSKASNDQLPQTNTPLNNNNVDQTTFVMPTSLHKDTSQPLFYVCYPIYCHSGSVDSFNFPYPLNNLAAVSANIGSDTPDKPLSFEEFIKKKIDDENQVKQSETSKTESTVKKQPSPSTSNENTKEKPKTNLESNSGEKEESKVLEDRDQILRNRKKAKEILRANAELHRKRMQRMSIQVDVEAVEAANRQLIQSRLSLVQTCIIVVTIMIFLLIVKRFSSV